MNDSATEIPPFPDLSASPLQRFSAHLQGGNGRAEARYRDLSIRSAFQPIFSFAHARPVGYEGLARAVDIEGNTVSPMTLLSGEKTFEGTVFLDRLLRTLHLANFVTPAF